MFELEGPAASALPDFGVTNSRPLTTSLTNESGDIVGDFELVMHKYCSMIPREQHTGPLFPAGKFNPLTRTQLSNILKILKILCISLNRNWAICSLNRGASWKDFSFHFGFFCFTNLLPLYKPSKFA